MIKSKPATLHAAMTSGTHAESSLPVSRGAGKRVAISTSERIGIVRYVARKVRFREPHHVGDHALKPKLRAVFRRVDVRDAVRVQLGDFGRDDHAAAAAEDLDMARPALAQHV